MPQVGIVKRRKKRDSAISPIKEEGKGSQAGSKRKNELEEFYWR
jgi:hypothetical protein